MRNAKCKRWGNGCWVAASATFSVQVAIQLVQPLGLLHSAFCIPHSASSMQNARLKRRMQMQNVECECGMPMRNANTERAECERRHIKQIQRNPNSGMQNTNSTQGLRFSSGKTQNPESRMYFDYSLEFNRCACAVRNDFQCRSRIPHSASPHSAPGGNLAAAQKYITLGGGRG